MIRAVLVDDEEPARVRLRAMLAEFGDVEVVGEAQDGPDALAAIAACCPDVIFLDIQMPGMTGLEVAACLEPPRPRIIFCTAYDQYAVDAFDQNAVDYLLKPLSRRRLGKALERMRQAGDGSGPLRHEVQTASETQARLLPQELPVLEGLEFAGRCRPARGVGGDFYDFLPLGDRRLGIIVSDVSGKGLFAGIIMASLQARVQSLAPRMRSSPGRMFREINRLVLATTDSNRYATMFYASYDDRTHELMFVNAGHDPPLLRRGTVPSDGGDRFARLEAGGPVVGMLPDADYRQGSARLAAGDLLVLFTDGLTEAAGSDGREFGVERLKSILDRHAELDPGELVDRIVGEVDRFRGDGEQADDLTVVVAKRRPEDRTNASTTGR